MNQPLKPQVDRLAGLLKAHSKRVVFAESCTAGLVSASLARVPGISSHLCGSAVVYRLDTKANWLGIPNAMLADPGPVSTVVATLMAERVLQKTPEADFAVSVTGHLGPDAPADLDGVIYIGVAWRANRNEGHNPATFVERHDLPASDSTCQGDSQAAATSNEGHSLGETIRERRQWMATRHVLEAACTQLEGRE